MTSPEVYGYAECEAIANYIKKKVNNFSPQVGIVCGSGLGGIVNDIEGAQVLKYHEIPNFPMSTVQGHSSELVFGSISGKKVVAMKGRFHPYEGHHITKVVAPIRIMKLLGVKTVIVSNAAGGINKTYRLNDVMIIKDHFNMLGFIFGASPLNGINDEKFDPRFPPVSQAYTPKLRDLAKSVWRDMKADYIQEGVYCAVEGHVYETIAEVDCPGLMVLTALGGDAAGMSTASEILAVAHCGMDVLGLSLITNSHNYQDKNMANHEEVLEAADKRSKDMKTFVKKFLKKIE